LSRRGRESGRGGGRALAGEGEAAYGFALEGVVPCLLMIVPLALAIRK